MEPSLNVVTATVVESSLSSVTDEMATMLLATAHSPLIVDLMDFTVAICDVRGDMVTQGVGMAIHLGALPQAIESLLKKFGDDMRPGDILMMNDPYQGGMHLPNLVVLGPCFADDRLIAYSVAMVHHTDIGGHVPGSVPVNSRDVFGEGLRIGPIRYERDGKRDETLIEMIESNTRMPRDFFGDLEAQISGCRVADRRIKDVVRRYGHDVVVQAMEGVIKRSERMARAEILAFPDGRYDFEDFLDSDGMNGPPQRIKVEIVIEGDTLKADFTGTSAQVATAINSPLSYTRSAFFLAVRSIMAPELPNTAGFFRPLELIAPEGTLVNPRFPAAVGAMGVTGYRVVDAVFGALAKAVPDRVRAASEGGTTRYTIGAMIDGKQRIFSEALVGASGGHMRLDGTDGIANIAGNMANSPVEMVEATFPILVEEYGYEPDSEGAGRHRGGLGVRRRIRVLAPNGGVLQIRSGRAMHRPWGAANGLDGTSCQNVLNPGLDNERVLKGLETLDVPFDTVYLHVTPGAGGYGAPEERAVELVARDVRDGKVSVDRARKIYRVEVSASGVVNKEATDRLRAPVN